MRTTWRNLFEGRRVRLRPAVPSDFDFFFELVSTPDVWYRWDYSDQFPHYGTLAARFEYDSKDGLLIETVTGEPVGWVCLYRQEENSGTAYLSVAVLPEWFDTGLGMEATGLFLEMIFVVKRFRKIYMSGTDLTAHTYRNVMRRYMVEEARFRDHDYFDGRYWDRVVWAIYRETWEQEARPRLYRLIGVAPPAAVAEVRA